MKACKLKARKTANYLQQKRQKKTKDMDITLYSFGFKYGLPRDAHLMIDVRFLPNPYWEPSMRHKTGLESDVSAYVLQAPVTQAFLARWFDLVDTYVADFEASEKPGCTIAVGCTGGQHRSVVIAAATARHLQEKGFEVSLDHRDINQTKASA